MLLVDGGNAVVVDPSGLSTVVVPSGFVVGEPSTFGSGFCRISCGASADGALDGQGISCGPFSGGVSPIGVGRYGASPGGYSGGELDGPPSHGVPSGLFIGGGGGGGRLTPSYSGGGGGGGR